MINLEQYVEVEKHIIMSMTAIYKNLISIYSALDLTEQGLYGPARIIFINILEYLIISKAVAIKEEHKLLKKWENGEKISLQKDVFYGVMRPNSDALKEY